MFQKAKLCKFSAPRVAMAGWLSPKYATG